MVSAIEARFCSIDETNRQKPGESRDAFYLRLLQEAETKRDAADKAAVLAAQTSGDDGKLTEEQKEYLSGRYELQNMSQEEYAALLKDLWQLGLVSGEDTTILQYGIPARLNGIWEAAGSQDPGGPFAYGSGNLLDWVRFRGSYECFDQEGTRYRDRTARLFDKLYHILTQMN